MPNATRDYNISALHSALQVLESFLQTNTAEQSLTEISQRLGLNKSRVFRILATLEQHGFVEQSETSRGYRLGLRLLAYGNAVQHKLSVVTAASPIMDDLAQVTGETVFLGVPDGFECIVVDKRESKHPIRLFGEVGRRAPLHVGGVPKMLLAYMAEEDPSLLHRLPLSKITSATVTDVKALAARLTDIRTDGYVVTSDDLDWGAHSIAAPIRNHAGRVVAALSVAGPSERFTPERIEKYISLVRYATDQISRRLGYTSRTLDTAVRHPVLNGHVAVEPMPH